MSDGRNRSGGRRPARGRGRGGASGGGQPAGPTPNKGKSKGGGRNRSSNKGRSRAPKAPPPGFWGDAAATADPAEPVVLSDDPAAVVRSLGPPPLGDRETIAEHYFEAVYGKAVALAGALAAAADLLATDDVAESDDS